MSAETEVLSTNAKKAVARSGVMAGNTVACTAGCTGNDLHYRGYDIVQLARQSAVEEVAFLPIHGALPSESDLKVVLPRRNHEDR